MASAHTLTAPLGKKAKASDIYRITCPSDGSGVPHLELQVRDLRPIKPPLLRVQARAGAVNVSSTDPIDGDAKASPLVSAAGGPGPYTVTVSKMAKKGKPARTLLYPEVYTLTYHCITGSEHTETDIQTLQNQ